MATHSAFNPQAIVYANINSIEYYETIPKDRYQYSAYIDAYPNKALGSLKFQMRQSSREEEPWREYKRFCVIPAC